MSNVEQQVIEGLQTLPTEHQPEVLNFVEFLRTKTGL